jgi:hypothetical protein
VTVELFANQPSTTVSSGGTTAPAQGTSQTWTVVSSTTFPAASSSAIPPTQFHVVDMATGKSSEIILVTNVSGSTWTVTRGAEGTTPVTHTVGFTIQQVVTAGGLSNFARQYNVTDWVNAVTTYGADPTGGDDSTTAIQTALLSFDTLGGWSQGQGGVVYLPAGQYKTSKPLIIPSGVTLIGSGWGSQLTLVIGSNCDVIQFATYDSTSQATILDVSASDITNAFWAGVRDLAIHGDSFYTTVVGYNHGINVTTNPLTDAAGSDPDFDPMPTIENVRIEACTGDGYFHNGRSGAFLKRVWSAYNNGNGFTFSFDTTAVDCLAEGTNCGFYLDHGSNIAAGCKSYNNSDNTWVADTSYAPGNICVYNAVMYFCILAVSGATIPSSDATHWTALETATAPQATGYGYYWDTNSGDHHWSAVEGQQNCCGDFYFKGPNAGTIGVDGQSATVNYNNGQPDYNAENPNHYAAVTLDGVSGVHVNLNSSDQSTGAGIICTSLNSPGNNTIIATTDKTESSVFYGGVPNFALVNGTGNGVTDWFNAVSYGADSTGTDDSTAAIQDAINATVTAGGGVVYFPAGNYKVESGVTKDVAGTAVYLVGDGRWITNILFYGSGDCIRLYDTTTYADRTINGSGVIGITIDGSNASGSVASYGLHAGDILQFRTDIAVQNFTYTGSMGVHFDNQYYWTEQMYGRIFAQNCTSHVVFDVASGSADTAGGSFDRAQLDISIIQGTDTQDGVVFQNGAYCTDGPGLSISGNFIANATPPTSAVLRITGTVAAGHPDAGTPAYIASCRLDIGTECDATEGQTGPYTIYFGSTANYISNCYGTMDFEAAGVFFQSSNNNGSQFAYNGSVTGDDNLAGTYVGNLTTSGVTVYGGADKPSFLRGDGNGLLYITDPAGLNSYIQQSQPAAISSATVANTTQLTSLGSMSVPTDDPTPGAVYRFSLTGSLSTNTTAPTYLCDVRWGGTAGTLLTSLHSTATANSPAFGGTLAAVPIKIIGDVSFRTGSTATCDLQMFWTNVNTPATPLTSSLVSTVTATTVTISSAELLSVDWQWGTSSTANTITIASSVFERVA